MVKRGAYNNTSAQARVTRRVEGDVNKTVIFCITKKPLKVGVSNWVISNGPRRRFSFTESEIIWCFPFAIQSQVLTVVRSRDHSWLSVHRSLVKFVLEREINSEKN